MANFLKSLFVKGIEIDPAGATSTQVLSYNGTKFVPAAAGGGGGGGASTLDDLTDVVITSPEEFQGLLYNGASWVNSYTPVSTYVRNAEATTLTIGTCVYLFGATGDHASVKRADNNSDTTSSKTIGVVGASITASNNGPIVTRGYVDGIDLSTGYTAGDVLWLGEAGAFTTTKPTAPDHLVFIGVVVRATNNGIIYVATQNGYELDELHNVSLPSPASGDFLKYNGSLWVADAIDLGTDTTGNYMSGISGTSPVSVAHTAGEGSSATVSLAANYGDTLNPYASKTANYVLAAPNGTAGVPAFRAIVAADIPTLNQNTTGSAATVTTNANLTGGVTSVGNAATVITNANLTGDVTSVGNTTTLTNAPVIAKVLTGYVSGSGTVAATDSILQAVQKLDGNDALKADLASPTFTGTPTLPTGTIATTQTAADSSTKVATTAFVTTADNLKANLASPTFTGTPLSTTAAVDTNTTQIATTAYVVGQGYAKLASPTFTGTVTVPTPTNSTDAVTKAYADAITQSLDIKDSVRVASTVNIAVASALINASTIDGVVVATGDRVLLKNQTAGAENGIYVVVASGAASRSTDANTSAKVTSGMYVFVSEGTVSADMGYVLTTNDAITLGTTSLSFTQFSGAGQITAGTGLSKSGNTLSVNAAQTGITSVGTLGSLTVTGDLTVDTDTLKVDSTNNRVGIGSKAKIGTFYSTAYMAYNSYFENIGGDGYVYDTNAAVSAISLQSDSIRFWTGTGGTAGTVVSSGEKMRLTTAGDLGIGTTTPATKLDVVGTATVRAAATQDGVALAGRAGGTSTYEVTLTPTTLGADRTLTLPDASGTVALLGSTMTGTWNGTAIAGQYGGTGVANTGKTITLGGNLTTSGAFTTTLTATANTSVTLPTSGTLTTTGKAIAMAIVFGS